MCKECVYECGCTLLLVKCTIHGVELCVTRPPGERLVRTSRTMRDRVFPTQSCNLSGAEGRDHVTAASQSDRRVWVT